MNPSPSSIFNDPNAPVLLRHSEMRRYLSKIGVPLLDRIDIHIEVTPVPFEKVSVVCLFGRASAWSSGVRGRV